MAETLFMKTAGDVVEEIMDIESILKQFEDTSVKNDDGYTKTYMIDSYMYNKISIKLTRYEQLMKSFELKRNE